MKNQPVRISLFYCTNSLQKNEIDQLNGCIAGVELSGISLPCSGKVDLLYVLKAVETGSDGVLLAGCRIGECKYLQGNFRAQKRIAYVDEILAETGFGNGHVAFVSLDEGDKTNKLLRAINALADTLRVGIKQVQE